MAGCSSSDLSLIYDPAPYTTPTGIDPWGCYVNEASQRFGVPEEYIRAVMTMEGGGRVRVAHNKPCGRNGIDAGYADNLSRTGAKVRFESKCA